MSTQQVLPIEFSIKEYSKFIATNCFLGIYEIQKIDSKNIPITHTEGFKYKSKGEKAIVQGRMKCYKKERHNMPWILKEGKKYNNTRAGK